MRHLPRDHAYTELHLPQGPDAVVAQLQRAFDDVAHQAERGLSANPFATMRDNRVHLKRRDALEVPPRLKQRRRAGEGARARVRIEDLLRQVDAWCGFTRAFHPPTERVPRIPNLTTTLLATLMAPGTPLGLATMAQSVEGSTADMLQEMSQGCLRAATLKAATAPLVNSHHHVPLSAVWGDGTGSSSDGQRFGLQASARLGSLSPRSSGYDDRAVTVYTQMAEQQSVLHTHVMACAVREALSGLDGLLDTHTILRPKEHFVDQQGVTDQLFGLCPLLGSRLLPRLPLPKHQRDKLDRTKHYGRLDEVIRGTVDTELIREPWAQLVRVAASLQNRTAPAPVGLPRRASRSPSDRLAKALAALGRALRTISL